MLKVFKWEWLGIRDYGLIAGRFGLIADRFGRLSMVIGRYKLVVGRFVHFLVIVERAVRVVQNIE